MDYVLITLSSVNSANKVKSLLNKVYNINSDIIQTPSEISQKGCSFSLKIKYRDMDIAWEIISKNKLSSKGIYSFKTLKKIK